MSYFGELRANWRPLAAASLGFAGGYNIGLYISALFTPHLMAEFGWSKAQFSLVGTTVIFTVVCAPIAGRLVDRFGVRAIATLGVVLSPLVYLGFSFANHDFRLFWALNAAQVILLGMTTTSVVYSRLIAEKLERARGVSLAIMASAPALIGGVFVPLLTALIDAEGWRSGYRALAVFSALAGCLALLLLRGPAKRPQPRPRAAMPGGGTDYRAIFANPAFFVIIAGMLLCNLPLLTYATHLKTILLERGLESGQASWLVSLCAFSVAAGRWICGIALDRWPTHLVASLAMGLPASGLFILASGVETPALLALAAAACGFSIGADGEVMAYTVLRFFKVEVYSSVLGFVGSAVAGSGALGALVLSWTLAATGGFETFLVTAGLAAAAGGVLFLLLARHAPAAAAARLREA